MKNFLRNSALIALLGISTSVLAGGFQLSEENVSGLGNAYAGAGAVAEDASTGFYNPAGLSYIPCYQVVFAGTMLNLNDYVRIPFSQSNFLVAPQLTLATPGNNREEAGGWALIPAIHFATPQFNKFSFGIGVTAPFGLTTSYSNSSKSRYFATYSNLTTINIGPTVAYEINRHLSVGAGFDAQYLSITLEQNVPVAPTLDSKFKNEADDWSYGWNIGALACFDTGTRVGVTYRSCIKHQVHGTSFITSPVSLRGDVTADITLPDYFGISAMQCINPCWYMLGSFYYTHWKTIDTVTLQYTGTMGQSFPRGLNLDLAFKDTCKYALAVNYLPNECWKLKLGVAYDETNVRNSKTRSFRLPDNNRVWLALGAQYHINRRFIVDLAYAYLFVHDANINARLTPASGGSLTASAMAQIDASVNQFGAQLTWNIQ